MCTACGDNNVCASCIPAFDWENGACVCPATARCGPRDLGCPANAHLIDPLADPQWHYYCDCDAGFKNVPSNGFGGTMAARNLLYTDSVEWWYASTCTGTSLLHCRCPKARTQITLSVTMPVICAQLCHAPLTRLAQTSLQDVPPQHVPVHWTLFHIWFEGHIIQRLCLGECDAGYSGRPHDNDKSVPRVFIHSLAII